MSAGLFRATSARDKQKFHKYKSIYSSMKVKQRQERHDTGSPDCRQLASFLMKKMVFSSEIVTGLQYYKVAIFAILP